MCVTHEQIKSNGILDKRIIQQQKIQHQLGLSLSKYNTTEFMQKDEMLWSFFPFHYLNIIANTHSHAFTFRIKIIHHLTAYVEEKKKKTSKLKSEQTHSNSNQRTEFIDFEFSMVKNNEEKKKKRIKRTYKIIECQNRERDAAPTKTTTRMKESMHAPETEIKKNIYIKKISHVQQIERKKAYAVCVFWL